MYNGSNKSDGRKLIKMQKRRYENLYSQDGGKMIQVVLQKVTNNVCYFLHNIREMLVSLMSVYAVSQMNPAGLTLKEDNPSSCQQQKWV